MKGRLSKIIVIIGLLLFIFSTPLYAKSKYSSNEDTAIATHAENTKGTNPEDLLLSFSDSVLEMKNNQAKGQSLGEGVTFSIQQKNYYNQANTLNFILNF